jgi:hypothetical protein
VNAVPHNTLYVWARFAEIYGRGFLTEFGELPNQSWIAEIEQLSPQDVERGIKASQASGSDFAPRLPRFLALCKPPIVVDVYRQERETRNRLDLPRPKSSREVREIELAKIRQELKILATPTASKEALEQRKAAMIQAAEILANQQEDA